MDSQVMDTPLLEATPALQPSVGQLRAATLLCAAAVAGTLGVLPVAGHAGPVLPAFVMMNQTALLVIYTLTAWVLLEQFRRDRSVALLCASSGALFTSMIVLLQLLSIPGVVAQDRVLGSSVETTTWLWTFWHAGPPTFAVAYALAHCDGRARSVPRARIGWAILGAVTVCLFAAAAAGLAATLGLPWLPFQVAGADYSAVLTSGVGPFLMVLIAAALAAMVRATQRRRSGLEMWIIVSLALLMLDNVATFAGGARGTIGWYFGRMEALASSFVILLAYLQETYALRDRAEAAAEELERTGTALRQAQKMEAVGRLTGGIAHDFNNLLMVVSSGFEMIRNRPDDRARVLKVADAGLEAAQRGARLTSQLLSFARRQHLRPETVNPNASLVEFEALARRAVGATTDITFTLHPGLYPASIDRAEFEAAVLNLVVNARDAMPAQAGSIMVSTRNGTRRLSRDASGHNQADQEYVVVTVADNGGGMDEATRLQAFEPFFTTKEFGKGSGLGLSQVYGFARASGGLVEITSTLGQGTTVEMWLPRVDAVVEPAKPTLSAASILRVAEQGETVIAVEDEPGVLAVVTENLTDLGYAVVPARDAAEALGLLRSDRRIDILFSDIVMPGGMNGVQLAVEASRIRPALRVLLTSGYTDEALSGQHSISSKVPILTKPYRREELAERLKVARQAAA